MVCSRRWMLWTAVLCGGCTKDARLQKALSVRTGVVDLPSGEIVLREPIVLDGVQGLTLRGPNTRLKVNFAGKAAILIRRARDVRLEEFRIEGNREQMSVRFELPPADQSMAQWNRNNGILIEDSENVTIARLSIRNVISYAILASRSKQVTIEEVFAGDSGTLDPKGLNNATGGILFEEGCERFAVRNSRLRNIRGNGIWTHSRYRSPRNSEGEFAGNDLQFIGRDALQAGHAVGLRILGNSGKLIGFPAEIVDMEHGAVPVAIDTAGNVEASIYAGNHFEEVNGKCIDLDGFHHGQVRENTCINRRDAAAYPHGHYGIVLNNSNPDMKSSAIEITGNVIEGFRFGGLFLIGEGHTVRGNVFRRLNLVRCNENLAAGCLYKEGEPDLLRTGIYLGKGAERPAPARGNLIENNHVHGYGMKTWCIAAAPGVSRQANQVRDNRCEDMAR
ncbi:MAG: right-handed parallel beta-helix repeat-containing protein [Acidobacteria bacterium]|nr:right-handed parallel beta-helix repeat-containing protein [Acidobacteriota bacterium]